MTWILWVKVVHVLAIISWMAGLLYLPRLFVYHAGSEVGSELSETFKVMERRLLRVIMLPAMVVAWGAGLALGFGQDLFAETWFILKLFLVGGLTVVHMMFAKYRREFEQDQRCRSERFFRIINEVPTLLMILVVGLVFLRPF